MKMLKMLLSKNGPSIIEKDQVKGFIIGQMAWQCGAEDC